MALLLAAVLFLFWPTWQTLPRIWALTATYNHGFVILPISLVLVWLRRAELARLVPRPAPLALFVPGGFVVLWIIGQAASVQAIQHIAVVGMVIGVVVTMLGRQISRIIAFPLLFLFFMVPEGQFLIPPLQDLTARLAVALLRFVDVPVFHSGFFIETPSGLFQVAEACAGIRFLIANVVVATLFAYLSFNHPWKWVVFLLLSVVVPIVANSLRAFGTIYIAYLTDNEYAIGVDHLVYGWGFFAAIMLLLLFIGSFFVDKHPPGAVSETPPATTGGSPLRPWLVAAVAVLLVFGPAYARIVVDPPATSPAVAVPSIDLDTMWDRLSSPPDWQPSIANADAEVLESYRSGGRRVDVFVAYFAFQRQGAEVVNYANRVADGERWLRATQGWHDLSVSGLPDRVRHEGLLGRGGRREVLWWYWIDGRFTANRWQAKWLQLGDRLFGRHRPAAFLAMSANIDDEDAEGRSVIEDFLRESTGFEAYLADFEEQRSRVGQKGAP